MTRFSQSGLARCALAALLMAMLAAPTTRASSGAQPASSPLFAPAVVDSAPATVACTAAIAPVRLTDGLPFTRHVVHGGESILLQAGGLPANAAIRVLLDLPRVRRSGSLEVPISYSPPTLAAGSDAAGTLVDAHGKKAVTVTLPADTATGTATISLVLQPGAGPAPALQAVRTWHVPVAPSAPAILVHTRPLTAVTYRVSDPAAPGTLCTGNANASGALLLTGVPAGTGYLAIGTASSPIVAYHPVTAPGEITQVQSSGPAVGAGVAQAAAGGACDQQTGTVTQLQDTLSGVATAKSGSGPFGDYLAGVSALDTFTAELTSIGAEGAYEPISHATPVQVVLIHPGQPAIGVGSVAIGADTAGAGTQATPGYTSATLKFDTSALEVGANVLEWQVGSGANACKVDFVLNAAKNPANTVLGTLDTYYDPAVGYQISGVLPTKPRLYFRKDIDLQLPAESLASAQLPAEVFQNWINEGDIGIDVHETIRTDGSWTGTVSGHARLIILNHTLYNDTLPTYSGGGASLTQGSMVVKAEHLAHESRNVSLYNALFLIPDINTVAVVNVHLTIGGDVTASIGIPASLDSVVFTLLPTLTFSIGGTGDVFTPLGNVSAGISGTLGLAAPITLHVPGGLGVTFGANVSVSAHFNSDVFGHADPVLLDKCLGDCSVVAGAQSPLAHLIAALRPGGPAPAYLPPALPGRTLAPGYLSPPSSARTPAAVASAPSTQRLVVPVSTQVGPALFDTAPSVSLSPDGALAAVWVAAQPGGRRLLRAQIGNRGAQTLPTTGRVPSLPRIAWIGAHTAVAVWSSRPAITGDPVSQHLLYAVWNGRAWTAPAQVATGSAVPTEPALAANPRTGQATLVWLACPAGGGLAQFVGSCVVTGADWRNGQWHANWTIPGALQGANTPSVAMGVDGAVHLTWLAGQLGNGHLLYAQRTAERWSAPTAIHGLPDGVQRGSLAVDAQGRPIVAVESSGEISAARQSAPGVWTLWNLGAGSAPQLASASRQGIALLTSGSGIGTGTDAHPLSVSVLQGKAWSTALGLPLSQRDGASAAIAVNPLDGGLQVIASGRPVTNAASGQPGGYGAGSAPTALDAGQRLYDVAIAPGSAATLSADQISLSDSHPAAGAPVLLNVQVWNLGMTTAPAGIPLSLTITVDGVVHPLRLTTAQPILANGMIVAATPLHSPEGLLDVRIQQGTRTIGQATLGRPPAPQHVLVTQQDGTTEVQWAPAADTDITGYAIYNEDDRNTPTLLGIASGSSWEGSLVNAQGAVLVATIDRHGRESLPVRVGSSPSKL